MTKQKKQMIVVGVLLLAVLAVGAFQFMGGKPQPVVADEGGKVKKEDQTLVAANSPDPKDLAIMQLLNQPGSPRDPFAPQAVLIDPEPEGHQVTPPDRPDPEINTDFGPVNPGVNGGIEGPIGTEIVPERAPFTLRGVMIGKKNLAVIQLDSGRQILVAEGEQFGPNSSVLAVSEHEVVIKVNGKVQTLPLGGN
jgi:hypothetical protein